MLIQSYLSLRTESLKPSEKWPCEGEELFLIFPQRGEWQITTCCCCLHAAGGDAIVLCGRSGAHLCAQGEGEPEFSWFSISLDSLYPLFAAGEICFLQNIPQALRNPKVYPGASPVTVQCYKLLKEITPKSDINHRSQLLRVAALLLSSELKLWQQEQFGFESADDHMTRVFEQLTHEELLNLSVEELSHKFGCSRRHLSRLFHQRFGLSVAAFRMEMRLLKALSLLRDPGVKVINVAEQCGFNHLGLFNTCFKRRFGVTPGLWRNTQTEKNHTKSLERDTDTCPLQISGLCPWHDKSGKYNSRSTMPLELQRHNTARLAAINGNLPRIKTTGFKAKTIHGSPLGVLAPSGENGNRTIIGTT